MSNWHKDGCQTTHCRAGWAIHLAGDAGYALERSFGPSAAGALIFWASCPGQRVPNFVGDNETALKSIQEDAAKET